MKVTRKNVDSAAPTLPTPNGTTGDRRQEKLAGWLCATIQESGATQQHNNTTHNTTPTQPTAANEGASDDQTADRQTGRPDRRQTDIGMNGDSSVKLVVLGILTDTKWYCQFRTYHTV